MKWIGYNAIGCLAWIAGLLVAKGVPGQVVVLFGSDAQRLMVGAIAGSIGLVIMLWANFGRPADLAG